MHLFLLTICLLCLLVLMFAPRLPQRTSCLLRHVWEDFRVSLTRLIRMLRWVKKDCRGAVLYQWVFDPKAFDRAYEDMLRFDEDISSHWSNRRGL